jgi:beta-lactam-binding protein with PASTA domain
VYLGQTPEEERVAVPDFVGMHRQQASDAAGQLGLYILVAGNQEIAPGVTAQSQSIPAGTKVPKGTTVQLQFVDTKTTD